MKRRGSNDHEASPGFFEKLALWKAVAYLRRVVEIFRKEYEMSEKLLTRTDPTPTRKVVGGAVGGAGATLVIGIAAYFGLDIPESVAGAIVTLVGFGAAYMTRDRAVVALRIKETP